jgi:uncharacterized iron-regulated membrane protein
VKFNVLNRKIHYWMSAAIALPLFVIACTGTILQLKKHSAWVQPPETRGSTDQPTVELSQILESLKRHPTLEVKDWSHVKRIDVRPDKGVAKAWLHTDYEAQVDLGTAEILQIAYRRSDWIESIHDGSIFGDFVKLFVFFPAAIALVLMWIGGMWMFVVPFLNKRRVRHVKQAAKSELRPSNF